MSVSFTPPATKLTIIGLDNGVTVVAAWNPKEVAVDKSVPWTKSPESKSDQPEMQFSSGEGRSMSFELFFDTYEMGTDVHALHVAPLLQLAMVMDPDGAEDKKRPTRVKVLWGTTLPPFEGVIESIGTKYTMFLPTGIPVRATCTVKVKEANKASFKKGG
jgi:hypothetical protein